MSAAGYRTLARESMQELVEQKSRFLCYVAPSETEEDALSFLGRVKEMHKQASHHCYAYIIGANEGIMRYQDDGEPAGTAGLPILNVLRAKQLVNCCAVVVRYFGGILLGAGGLVRAYTKSCTLGIDHAGTVMMESSLRQSLSTAYPLWDRVRRQLSTLPVLNEETTYAERVQHHYIVREIDAATVLKALMEASDGQIQLDQLDALYYAWPDDLPST